MSNLAQSLKSQIDIVKIIEGYTRLRKTGAVNYTGLCPFHKEKTGSFSVQAERQFFHCFGCQVSGDVFAFIQKIENVDFPEAVRIAAEKAGIQLPEQEFDSAEDRERSARRKALFEIHERAAKWFSEQLALPEGALAREYLAGRGLKPESISEFGIGYAPDSFNSLRDHLGEYADSKALEESGLFTSKQGRSEHSQPRLYDRFRKRVMFPIRDQNGKIIAFTARVLPGADPKAPKYLNSPETPLYSKGRVLFNLDKAKSIIREYGYALLVEGQMDAISVYVNGIRNVIASSGTALTEHQVALLKRHTANVAVNFDPDAAGTSAMEKSLGSLTEAGFQIKLLILDGGLDPDKFIRERGIEAYGQALRLAVTQDWFLIERAKKMFPGATPQDKAKAANFLLPHMRRLPDAIARDRFVQDAAQKLDISSGLLIQEMRSAAQQPSRTIDVSTSGLTRIEQVLLRILLSGPNSSPDAIAASIEAIRRNPGLFEHLNSFPTLARAAESDSLQSPGFNPMDVAGDAEQQRLVAEALFSHSPVPGLDEVNKALSQMELHALEIEQQKVRVQYAEAERARDEKQIAALDRQICDLHSRIYDIHRQRAQEAAMAFPA